MTTIYMDESGFTGDDLYNPSQPHFVLASTLVGDDEALAVLRRCFPRYGAAEYKFSTIWRRDNHRSGLRALAREMPALADRAFVWIVDKRFSLLVKMFDYLVEPSMYEAGFDFYSGGYARRYLNTVHRDILRFGSEDVYDRSVRLWDAFARAPSSAALASLRDQLREVAQASDHPISTIYAMLEEGTRRFEAMNPRLEDFADSSEIQITSILSTVTYWRQQRSEDFDLVLDESTSFVKRREIWEALVRDDGPVSHFEQGNGTTVQLPLRVRSTTTVRSEASPAVQLCDLLAGLGSKFAGPKAPNDPFLAELVDLGMGTVTMSGVQPHDDYATEGAPRREGPDMVDRMVEHLRPHLDRQAATRASNAANRNGDAPG